MGAMNDDHLYDVAIVGAGPIGLEIASVMKRASVDYIHFEAGQIGNSLMWWPRNTVFFSSPEWIAIAGVPIQSAGQEQITGESYLAYLRMIVESLDLEVRCYEPVGSVEGVDGDFRITTTGRRGEASYRARKIVLAIGDMARPNRLGIEGEDLPFVTHYFQEPHRYFRQRLCIIGGKNSALEAAIRSWRAGADVTLCYRRPEIEKNRTLSRLHLEISILIQRGQIRFLGERMATRIGPEGVWTRKVPWTEGADDSHLGDDELVEADFVLIATGFRPDPGIYDKIGVILEGERMRPRLTLENLESNIPGVYVAGTATAGNQEHYTTFITTCHDHGLRILRQLRDLGLVAPGDEPPVGNLPKRQFPLDPEDIE